MRIHDPYAPRRRLGNLGATPVQNGGTEHYSPPPPPPPSSSPAPAPAPAPAPVPAGDGGGSSITYAQAPAELPRYLPRSDVGYSADRGPRVFKHAVTRSPEYLHAAEIAPGSSAGARIAQAEGAAPLMVASAHVPEYLSPAERRPAPGTARRRRRLRGLAGLGNGGGIADYYAAQQAARKAAQAALFSRWLAVNRGYDTRANPPPGAYISEPIDSRGNRVWYSIATGELVFGIDPDTMRLMPYRVALAKGYNLGSYGIPDNSSNFDAGVALQFAAIAAPVVFAIAAPVAFAAEAGAASAASLVEETAPAVAETASASAPEYLTELELAPVSEAVITPTVEVAPFDAALLPESELAPIPEDVITPTGPASGSPELPTQTPGLQDTIKKALTRLLTPTPHPSAPATPSARPAASAPNVEANPASGFMLAAAAGIVFAVLKGIT